MYKIKFRIVDDDTEYFLKLITRKRSPENIKWLREHGFGDGDTYDIYHYVKTLEEATELDAEMVEYNSSALHVLFNLKSLEIIRSDEGGNV